jgi:hypothetical protein
MKYVIIDAGVRDIASHHVNEIIPDGKTVVEIKPYRRDRSREQNDMFHGLMRQLSRRYMEHYGAVVDPDVWKEYFKRKFLGEVEVPMRDGSTFTMTRGTHKLKVDEMSMFIDDTIAYCAEEIGIVLETPTL